MVYEVTRLQAQPPTDTLLGGYGALVPENLTYLLQFKHQQQKDSAFIAIGATYQGTPVGIALAEYHRSPYLEVSIHYLFVSPEHRRKHLGTKLLKEICDEGYQEGGRLFTFVYSKGETFSEALEKIFVELNWQQPAPFILRCEYHSDKFMMPPLFSNNKFHYPPGYEDFLWKDRTPQDHEEALFMIRNNVRSTMISPFLDTSSIEPLNSLGLRYQGHLVGWLITNRLLKNTISYSGLYVNQSVNHRGIVMVKLIANAINLQKNYPYDTKAILEVPMEKVSTKWINFVKHHLIPCAEKVTWRFKGWKAF